MACSKYQSTQETTNLARIVRIILGPCTDVLRDVLAKVIHPSSLSHEFKSFVARSSKYTKLPFSKAQMCLVSNGDYSNFDISLLYFLLRNICSIPPHVKRWGNVPDPNDRSLSANIERIRIIRNESLTNSKISLSNSEFEEKWTNIFTAVQEIECYIGSSNIYQKTLMELKMCSMDPNHEENYILKFQGVDKLQNEITKLEVELGQTKKTIASLNVKDIVDEITKTTFQGTAKGGGRSGSKAKLSFGQTNVMEDFGAKVTYEEMSSFQPITSENLKELFNSFKVEYPDDPHRESFIHQILQDDLLKKLVTSVKSLSRGIVLTKSLNKRGYGMPTVGACVFEVDVVFDGDQFSAVRKDASSNDFFKVNEDYLTRVMLIKSKSLPVIDAKLVVYKKYRHVINRRKIILQHEYEEFDDVAKFIAYQMLSSFCTFVESVINAFTMDLHTKIFDYLVEPLTVDNIKGLCEEVFERIEDETIGTFENKSKSDWRRWVADEIGRNMRRKGELLCSDSWVEIKNICQKTVKDLNAILIELEEFQACFLPVDQNKQIEEWLKRDVIRDESILKMHPSIIKYITGYKDRDDKKQVIKVYIHGDDKKAENFFKECCQVSEDTHFEFVNVEKSKGKSKELEELKQRERKAPAVDNSTKKQLKQIIQEYGDKIYARHSNVVGIRIGKARRVYDTIQEQPCLVLYCLDKCIIPFGEKPLPEAIAGWPCDIREDFVRFGICPNRCLASKQNLPDPGCSIGIPFDDSSGSVGFLVESKNPPNSFEFGFLTASHVAVKRFEQLYHDEKLLSMHSLKLNDHFIVHPSWIDNEHIDHKVGKVVESFCGNYGLYKIGLDFAVIASNHCRNGAGKETLTVATEDDLNFEEDMVTKTGRTTGTTYGYLIDNSLTVKVDRSFLSRGYFAFFNCYAIEDNTDDQPFFLEGDSGSGVYIMENGKPSKPLGIAFAYLDSQTAVCNIGMIVDKLDLQIVRYLENKENFKKFLAFKIPDEKTEEKSEKPMDVS